MQTTITNSRAGVLGQAQATRATQNGNHENNMNLKSTLAERILPLLATIIYVALAATSAQAQFLWSERIVSAATLPSDVPDIGMCLDTNGNCYVTGWFDGTNNFGGVILTNLSVGGSDIFVAKYNATGALQWAQRAGGTPGNLNTGRGIGVDANGNIYVSGGYWGAANFGSETLPSTSGEEFFLAKYNTNGVIQWIQVCTNGSSSVGGIGLAVDRAGNSFVLVVVDYLGGAGGTVTFGSTNITIPDNGSTTLTILVKYDNTGAAKWAQLFDSSQESYATKVAVDAAGNVYVRGTFTSDMTIGTSNLTVSAGSTKNMFIAKFNNAGALTWVQQPTGGDVDEGGVAVDPAGNVYVSGSFDTNLNFGGITLTNAGSYDAFLAKYSSSGSIQWARQAGGGTNSGALVGFYWDVALDGQGNVYAAGFLNSGAAVAKYDPAGNLQWTCSASGPPAGPASSLAAKCAVDSTGNCYLAGWYQGTATFGTNVLQPQGYWNFFLAKTTPAFPIATSRAASQAGLFAAFGGTNYLVGIQGDGTINNTAISAQLISTNGTLLGSRVLTGRTGGIPYVASGRTNFLLVWSDNKLVAGGGNDQVYGQFISRSGALVGTPFTFGPTSEEQDMQGGGGSLLAFDGRNYLAVWDTGAFHDATSGNVHGALFNQNGSLVVPVISITSGTNPELTPVVTFGRTNYLVVWNDLNSGNIYGEFISTNGTQSTPFVISQTPTPSYNPCCAAFDGTNFFVVWDKNIGSVSPNTIWNLYGRLVSPSGAFPGNEVAMVTDTNSPVYPSIDFDGANYLLAWNVGVQSTNSQIVFQYFDQSARPVGAEFNLFSPQGTNAPLFGGVLFDGNRFEITAVVGGAVGIGSSGIEFTSSTGTWGTFLSTNGIASPLVVNTTSLPNGTNGVAYTKTLVASEGQPPYSWTTSSGVLPPGLTLATNGVISGTPTTNGTFNFTVKVTDAVSATATRPLTLTVLLGPPSVAIQPTNNPVTVTVGNNVSLTVSVAGTGPFNYQWQLNGTDLPNDIITTVAGSEGYWFYGDGGAATNAELTFPSGVAVDATGNLFIADSGNNRIRKVGTNGIINTVAGNGTSDYSGDGGAATNAGISASGVVVDATGNLFIADLDSNRIRKVGTNGIINTVAGNGTNGYSGDGGAAINAKLNQPWGVAVDGTGNLFIADSGNNRIRKVDINGIITTVAGNGTGDYFGDGGAATNAELYNPVGAAVDATGNLFIADDGNGRIRKVGIKGIIATVAGSGSGDYLGDGGAATNAGIGASGVVVDATGNLFIADSENNRIRKVDSHGIITTVAGIGNVYIVGTFSGDGGAATNAELYNPVGVAVDGTGNLFIADQDNQRIRKVASPGPTLVLNNVGFGNAGAYDVVVSSPYGSVTSSVVNLIVTLPPVILSAPQITIGNTNFTFLLSGPAGSNYVLQDSTNLLNWSLDSTSTIPASGSTTLSKAISGYNRRFYRVQLQ